MKKIFLFVLCIVLSLVMQATAYAEDGDEGASGISLTGKLMSEDGTTFLVVSIDVYGVTNLNSARVDVIYSTEDLELVNVSDDADLEQDGRQNFLGSNILSVNEIKELGVSEYAVSRVWEDVEAPEGSEGGGRLGLLIFRILSDEESSMVIKRETLRLLKDTETPIPEFTEELQINDLTFDPKAQ